MSKWRRFALLTVIIAGAFAACWFALGRGRRRFQGRTEREWIQSLRVTPGSRELGKWQALGSQALPMLSDALDEGTSPLRRKYEALWRRLPRWSQRRLPQPEDCLWIHRNALQVLSTLRCDVTPDVPAVGRALHDDDPIMRLNASTFLADLMPGLGAAKLRLLPDLLAAMHDQNAAVRNNATRCLGFCPEYSQIAGPALARAMNDPDQRERYLAVTSFSKMDFPAAARGGTAELLADCLTNRDMFVRANAAEKLSELKQNPSREVPVLLDLLNDPLPAAQCVAAVALGRYGADARPAVPALLRSMKNGEPRVRTAASNALAWIDPKALSAAVEDR